ncbi:hypothetical protein KUCAC02_007198 [Chaenocephalus aceratus]|uniref:Uncharacterized protein n=1 Tax=Chaenocephalus aceratus TaxID=36190 RepID=A0ACB9X4Y1_CHAAC|nr:hypothetical protein KUCAC02_007198 [Chaenocephalus aceratus]
MDDIWPVGLQPLPRSGKGRFSLAVRRPRVHTAWTGAERDSGSSCGRIEGHLAPLLRAGAPGAFLCCPKPLLDQTRHLAFNEETEEHQQTGVQTFDFLLTFIKVTGM